MEKFPTTSTTYDETAVELHQRADQEHVKLHEARRPGRRDVGGVILFFIILALLCYVYEDPFFIVSRLLRGEFPDNDAFVAFLEFYHT
jgi:hypothetical protein